MVVKGNTGSCVASCVAGVELEGRSSCSESVVAGGSTGSCVASCVARVELEGRSSCSESVVVGGSTGSCVASCVAGVELEGRSGGSKSVVVGGSTGSCAVSAAEPVPGVGLKGRSESREEIESAGESTDGCAGDCVDGVELEGKSVTGGCAADPEGRKESAVVGGSGRTGGCTADSVHRVGPPLIEIIAPFFFARVLSAVGILQL